MTDEEALLQAIHDAPEDHGPRLVYSDWLEEHGNSERAEFIRVQCELARPGRASARRKRLQAREQELLVAHRQQWLGKLRKSPLPWVFHRGFVERLGASGVFRSRPIRWKDETWWEYLRFFPDGSLLEYMKESPSQHGLQQRMCQGSQNRDVRDGTYTLDLAPRRVAVCFVLVYHLPTAAAASAHVPGQPLETKPNAARYVGTIARTILQTEGGFTRRGIKPERQRYQWLDF